MSTAAWLVLAVGNPSRGDDALGPRLVDRLLDAGVDHAGDVELLVEHQLQIEHALDLRGRRGVLFVDAARAGAAAGVTLAPIAPSAQTPVFSHALSAPALLQLAQRLDSRAPPAWQLAIGGESFALGAELSASARRHLDAAVAAALDWLRVRRAQAA
jgi:hydrogenase maturation protease